MDFVQLPLGRISNYCSVKRRITQLLVQD